jgi:quercetin dioxygenase-like cupin family protein
VITPLPFDPSTAEVADEPTRFEGTVARTDLFRAGGGTGTDVTGVHFAPGARTVPHTHSVDQILYAVSGLGELSLDGIVHRLEPGDWVVIPAGTHHWHGATADQEFVQMAIKPGGQTDWLARDDEWANPEPAAERRDD